MTSATSTCASTKLRPDLLGEFTLPEPVKETTAATQPAKNGAAAAGGMENVAYQGEPGAYSQEAIFQHLGAHCNTLACPGFGDIFTAVEEGRATLGLLPVENSQAGSINQAYDLLLDHDLRVVGEVKLRVRHCLLAPDGAQLRADIRRVHLTTGAGAVRALSAHARAGEPVPAYDTAGAAAELARNPAPGTAAIASALAGQTYGLDSPGRGHRRLTRQHDPLLPGREEPPPAKHNKTSIVFATMHTPGALYNVMGEFANRGINLTKIESRPRRNRPWHYVFYVDMEGHWQDTTVNRALLGLLTRTRS